MSDGLSLQIDPQAHEQDEHVFVFLIQTSALIFEYFISEIFYYIIYSPEEL